MLLAAALLFMESTFYVGTYTDPQGSKGIYRVRLNTDSGALSIPELVAETTAPSYLAIHPRGGFLYAVNEFSKGEVTSFVIEPKGLRKLNSVSFDGSGPCHVSLDPSGKWLFVSAYGGGTITVLPVAEDGTIGPQADRFANKGSGPNARRQESPHMHFAATDPQGRHLYACDLGTDEVLAFKFDSKTGKLEASPSAKVAPGGGPRHFVLSANGARLYALSELTLGISVFHRNAKDGSIRFGETISLFPGDEPIQGSSMAAIRQHPKLPVIYASIRGKNLLAVLNLDPRGIPILLGMVDAGVNTPRDFAVDPSGQWLVAAGQSSSDLMVFKIDQKSGMPSITNHRAQVPKPVNVVFQG